MSTDHRFTDARLDEMERSASPGDVHIAPHLRRLDTPERRGRAHAAGMTLMNLRGGRPSDNIGEMARALARLVEEGREDEELFPEARAREYREQDRAARALDPYGERVARAHASL